MLSDMQKIIVIGCPGAGKTTFSKQLAKKLGLPLYHLDYFYYDNRFDYPHNTSAWRQRITELVHKEQWIIDGNYKSTFDIRFPQAEAIIYLDYPLRITLSRALKRRVVLHGKVRDDMPSSWKEQFSLQFLRFILSYNRVERPKLYKLLQAEQRHRTVIILRSPRQTERYLAAL